MESKVLCTSSPRISKRTRDDDCSKAPRKLPETVAEESDGKCSSPPRNWCDGLADSCKISSFCNLDSSGEREYLTHSMTCF